jgi:hypothetical protein
MGGVRNPNFDKFAGAAQPRQHHIIAPTPALIGTSDGATTVQALLDHRRRQRGVNVAIRP